MSDELTALQTAVAAVLTAVGDAATEIQTLTAAIQQSTGDPAALTALTGQLNDAAATLETAVTTAKAAMTPAETPPAETPPADTTSGFQP